MKRRWCFFFFASRPPGTKGGTPPPVPKPQPLPETPPAAPDAAPAPAVASEKEIDKPKSAGYIDLREQLAGLNAEQLQIITAIDRGETHIDDIIESTGLSAAKVLSQLTILEIKVQESIPFWLSEILDTGRIYKSSFSKYGEAYRQQLCGNRGIPLNTAG